MNVSFPLRDGYFRTLNATREDEARWKALVCGLVDLSLVEERPYYASNYEYIDRRRWKFMRGKDQLRVYKPRRGVELQRGVDPDAQCLLAVGTIEGTLEDVIYGVHHVTTKDMRATTSFLSRDALDSAVLHVVEQGSEDDQFRSLALKWRILETPAGSLVKNRDVCAFEYVGIAHDDNNDRYAFHVVESIDHPVCPPFNPSCAVRARTHTRIIYRQISPTRVGMHYRGEYTTGGRIPNMIARWTAAEVAVSIRCSVECAEAKKLTQLAVANAAAASDKARHRQPVHKQDLVAGSKRCCAICSTPTLKVMHTCQVCGAAVCGKCKSKKYLMSDEGKIPVSCCKQCILAARDLRVDPRQPLVLISAAYAKGHGVIMSASAHSRSDTLATSISITSDEGGGKHEKEADDEGLSTSDETETFSGDVLDLLAGMSFISESTSTSRDDVVSVDLSASTYSDRSESEELWRRMQELRLAAEQTYRMTKKYSQDWQRGDDHHRHESQQRVFECE